MLLGLLASGCQNQSSSLDPQQPRAIRAAIKSGGGQTLTVPARSVPPPATVALIRDNNASTTTGTGTSTTYTYNQTVVSAMVSQALDGALGAGGIGNLVHSGDTVLIKPNMVSNKTLAVTDWHVVKALVDLIKTVNGGAAITIADGSASQDSISIMTAQGFTAASFPGVTFANFNDTTTNPTNTYVLADSRTGANEQIPALITDADVYIDMPKMKTHGQAGYTGACKNLGIGTGPLPLWTITGGSAKAGLHHDIRSEIVDHIACRVPDLTIMDAVQAMEGQGPASGTAVSMNLVLASKDPVALDAVACTIMGIPPSLITHLVLAANENIGVMDMANITVAGNATIAAVQRNFTRANPASSPQGPTELGIIPYRATTVIRPAPAAMTIDGDLSEWGYANTMTADATYQVKGTGSSWAGPSDSSVTAQTMYDAQNLYLAVHVKDDIKLVNNNTGSAIANGDGIELYLSTYTRAVQLGARNQLHFTIRLSPGHQLRQYSAGVHALARHDTGGRGHEQGRHERRLRHRGANPVEQFRQPHAGAGVDVGELHGVQRTRPQHRRERRG